MLISDIKPYERNARHNDKAIPKVAESIRKFGLRGSIVLESRDNPVIVCGHTRVAAAKSLGWTEIPDDHIEYCDGLTQDEIDAFRLIDNKTGEIATWNVALLKSEAKRLNGKLDFARYGFDFKSKVKPYGAERARTDDYYNLRLCDIDDCGPDGMPLLAPTDIRPARLIGFNYAKSWNEPKTGVGIHFFLDDYQFERIWNKPEEYTRLLASFDMACAPDWSLYLDMPRPMQQWNVYRSRAIGDWWQRQQARRVRQPNPKQGHLDQTHQLLRQGERGAGIQERQIHHHQHLHQIRQPIHLRLRKGELDMTTKNTTKKTSADEWWKPPVQRTRSRAEMAARANEDSRAFIKVNAKALGLDKKKSGK